MPSRNKADIPKGEHRALVRVGGRSAMGFNHRSALDKLNLEGVKAFSDEVAPIVERLLTITKDVDMAIVTRDLVEETLKVTGRSGIFNLPKNLSDVRPKTLSHLQTKYGGEKIESN
ncbi:hypothetical protein HYV64_00045 [Candidatus Shapirobacteria bacterium]|nr:hypothetical protein [Candidatus Shapirobacteria bacterium]